MDAVGLDWRALNMGHHQPTRWQFEISIRQKDIIQNASFSPRKSLEVYILRPDVLKRWFECGASSIKGLEKGVPDWSRA